MRIVAGELGGRLLVAPRGQKVRPTSDRVREAIFSALGSVEGAVVLDLYCGTGALGIEALSRGAKRAVLVDRDVKAALGNVENLGLRERAELIRANLPEWLDIAARPEGAGHPAAPFDLILCDPPYKLADRIGEALDNHLAALLAPTGRLVVESPASRPLTLPSMRPLRERRYGGTHVAFYGS